MVCGAVLRPHVAVHRECVLVRRPPATGHPRRATRRGRDVTAEDSMRNAFGMAAVAVVMASGIPATAHHSNPLYFDMDKPITLEGRVLGVRWVNPHILLFLETKNDRGEVETWTLQGTSLNNAMRQVGLKERLRPGI